TECHDDTPDYVEIQNVSGHEIDTSGWVVALNDAESSNINTVHDVVWELPETMSAGEVLYRTDDSGENYWGSNIWWGSATCVGWAMVVDDAGNVVDFEVWGYSAPQIASLNVVVNGHPITIGSAWSAPGVSYDTGLDNSLARIGDEDHNDASDFSWTGGNRGAQNPGLSVPFVGGRTPVAITPTTASFVNGVWTGEVTILGAAVDMYLLADDGSGNTGSSNEFTVELLPPVRVNLPAGATEGDGVISGTVSIYSPQPRNLHVTLVSSDVTEATVPGSVTILAGQTAAPLNVTIMDDAYLDGTKTVRITPTAVGYSSAWADVDVYDNETAVLTVELPAGGEEGQVVTGTVRVSAATGDDVLVGLISSDTSEATVPARVTIPSGQTSATFPVTLVQDGQVDGTQRVTITAHVENWTDGSDSMDVVNTDLGIVAPGELPTGYLGIPYNVMLEAEGGTAPYTWSVLGAGQYVETNPGPSYIGGGAARGWNDDDGSWSLALPWGFDFYGTVYNSVWVCSNGFLDFTSSTADFTNSLAELLNAVRISAIWYDLDTYVPCDIYVGQTADYVPIRWDAEVLGSGPPVDAEIVLYRNGDILFNYGDAHSGFTPTIGMSAGDNTIYTVAFINGSSSIPADTSLLFSDGGRLPGGLT
ncbi:MAG: hypothetical protein WBF17_09720, partial [Phycisphaerae bacterium]